MTHKTYPDKIDHRIANYVLVGFKDGRRDKPLFHCDCGLIFIAEDPRVHYPLHQTIIAGKPE